MGLVTSRFAFLVVLVACSTAPSCASAPSEMEKYGTGLWKVESRSRWGTGFAIGPHELVTASHVVARSKTLILNLSAGNPVSAQVETVDPRDREAATLRVSWTFPEWRDVGLADTGTAEVETLRGRVLIEIVSVKECTFKGWCPWAGSSGSPVIQKGKVVGVVCVGYRRWGGGYAMIPVKRKRRR